jgi:hypothetical protein
MNVGFWTGGFRGREIRIEIGSLEILRVFRDFGRRLSIWHKIRYMMSAMAFFE